MNPGPETGLKARTKYGVYNLFRFRNVELCIKVSQFGRDFVG